MLKPSIIQGECDQVTLPDNFNLSDASTVTIIDTVNCCNDPFVKIYSTANGDCFKEAIVNEKTYAGIFNYIVSLKINIGGTVVDAVPPGNKLTMFNDETFPDAGLHPDTNFLKNRVNDILTGAGVNAGFDIILELIPLPPNPLGGPVVYNFNIYFRFSGLVANLNPVELCLQDTNKNNVTKRAYEFNECNENNFILPIDEFGSIVLLPSFFDKETIPFGIHNITVKIDYALGGVFQQNYCTLVDCDILCKLTSLNPESNNYIRLLNYYNGLLAMLECNSVDCSCDKSCEMYEFIVSELNKLQDLDSDNCKTC